MKMLTSAQDLAMQAIEFLEQSRDEIKRKVGQNGRHRIKLA